MDSYKKLKRYVIIKYISIISTTILFMVLFSFYCFNIIFNEAISNKWLIATIISIVLYVASIVYFIINDPINNIDKYSLKELLEYCTRVKSKIFFLEILAYISSVTKNIFYNEDNNESREKEISRMIDGIFSNENIKINTKKNAFKEMCRKCIKFLEAPITEDDKVLQELEISKIIKEFIDSKSDSKERAIKLTLELQDKAFFLFNITALVGIFIAMWCTSKKITPGDTYIYAIASIILILHSIIEKAINIRKYKF
ncbi:hypothetical protein FDF64_14665 [Clostridium botulinum]|nr:hypothetical protein [Clostridium botulinum]